MRDSAVDLIFIALGLASILVIVWLSAAVAMVIRSIKPFKGTYQPDLFDRREER